MNEYIQCNPIIYSDWSRNKTRAVSRHTRTCILIIIVNYFNTDDGLPFFFSVLVICDRIINKYIIIIIMTQTVFDQNRIRKKLFYNEFWRDLLRVFIAASFSRTGVINMVYVGTCIYKYFGKLFIIFIDRRFK